MIASAVRGKTVIDIWNHVFEKCDYLKEVIFEEGSGYIGKAAFAECRNLKRVKLPESLCEIEMRNFAKTFL